MRKKTHEQYEDELKYKGINYIPLELYINSRTKILHKCVNGHHWYVRPNCILKGRGCPECSKISKTKTDEEYAQELSDKNIQYKPIEQYKGTLVKIMHECPKRHQWFVRPRDVLQGRGCPVCSDTKRTSEEYNQALLDKGIEYKPLESYTNNKTKILHECSLGHQWYIKPKDILRNKGCPTCASYGFDPTKSAKLYFFSFEHNEQIYYKVGVTNRTTQERHAADWNPLKIRILWELNFEIGSEARELEKQIIGDNSMFLINTGALRSGNTETFTVFIDPPKESV